MVLSTDCHCQDFFSVLGWVAVLIFVLIFVLMPVPMSVSISVSISTPCFESLYERGSGARMSVHMEHRDVNDRAPLRLTIWGDDTALTEAERQLKEAALASMRFAEKVIVARQAGAVIGKGGAHIKRIQEHTGTYVSVASRADNSDAPRSVVIRGAPECVEMAARLVFAAMRGRNEFEAAMAEDVVSAPNFFYCAHQSL